MGYHLDILIHDWNILLPADIMKVEYSYERWAFNDLKDKVAESTHRHCATPFLALPSL